MDINKIYLGDNIEVLKTFPDNSVDAIVTDSPYGLGKPPDPLKVLPAWLEHGYYEVKGKGFMGKNWDAFVPQPVLWKECLRVLKPGGYLLSFFGTRTYDWGTMAIRIAGFEIRDCIQWIYGSGFPKSKASLKPANEPICVARKPGPLQMLNIDECRIPMADGDQKGEYGSRINTIAPKTTTILGKFKHNNNDADNSIGRWPSNIIFDEEMALVLDGQSGISGGDRRISKLQKGSNGLTSIVTTHKEGDYTPCYQDIGGASRFFYVAKSSPSERAGRKHPTIKPIKLMTQLVQLVTPKGGVCLDCHSGSGTTLAACQQLGIDYIGIDNDTESVKESNIFLSKSLPKLF